MGKYAMTMEVLGKRVTGFMLFDSESKGFVGMTEKQIKEALRQGENLHGLVLDADGNIAMDRDNWHTSNMMVRSGINTLTPAFDSDCPANMMYVVVGMRKAENGETVYEVVNSRYARLEMPEGKVKMLCEFGAIQGGVYMVGEDLKVCEGVVVQERTTETTEGNKRCSKYFKGETVV